MANYTPDYTGGDVAKAGQSTITTLIIEFGTYAGLFVLGVMVVLGVNAMRKIKK